MQPFDIVGFASQGMNWKVLLVQLDKKSPSLIIQISKTKAEEYLDDWENPTVINLDINLILKAQNLDGLFPKLIWITDKTK